jgi:hypothetical protein
MISTKTAKVALLNSIKNFQIIKETKKTAIQDSRIQESKRQEDITSPSGWARIKSRGEQCDN